MEAKRRRLSKSADPVTPPRTSVPDGGSPKTTARSTRSATSMAKIVEALREELSSCELEKAQKSLGYLKKKLSSKISVSDFMRSEKSFPTLITVFHESFSKLNDTKAGDSYAAILRETISVIANCCHLSLESCLRLKPANAKVINSALRILESGTRTSWTLKACVLRLIANLCEHKETAMCVVEAPQLVDRIAMMVSAEDENTSKNALRIVRLLSSSFSRYVVLSNACHYIGQLLNKVYYEDSDPRKAAILAVLQTLSRNYARDVGRQLAAGLSADDASPRNCTKDFLALLLRDPTNSLSETEERWVALILSMTLCSFELREIFGEDAIREAVSIEDAFKNANLCKFLSFFSYDAWGRAKLRESGALTIILQRLDETRELDERDVIVSSLRHFIHDTIGMGFLLKHSIFPTIALKHLREYLKNRSYTCTPELKAEDDLSDALACVTSAVTVSLEENPSSSSERLRKEYTTEPRSPSCNWSPSMSSYSNSLSPSPSSTSDDLYSLNWAGGFDNDDASSRPSVGDRFTLSHLSFNEEPTSKKLNKEEQAIAGEMFILSWLSHEEVNHKYLINQEIVSALVGYISRAPTLDLKAARSLKRLARSRACIHQLLEIRFQTIVVHYLLRQPCTLVRNAKTCDRCDKRMEYGREVLREFSTHIDSEFGWSYLSQSLKSSNKQKRLSSYLAGLILLRSGHHRKRFMQFFHPLDELWEYLSAVLKDKNAFEEDRLAMEPPLSCQLLVALSILVTSFPSLSEENDILEVLPKFLVSEDKCFVESQDDSVPTLKFRSKQGALLATVPKDRVCSASEYFRGMFGSEFLESIENRQEFVFDPTSEGCDESDFTNFLHFLSGCRQKRCFSVTSAKRCVSLLYLADRYLCSELSKFLLHPKIGSVKTLLNGDNLQEFLPVCLSISRIDQQLGKMCMRTMLQFSSDAQLTKTLETLVGDSRGTELFVRFLKDFLNRYERAWSS